MTGIIGPAIGAAGLIGGGVLASRGATEAAQIQAQAASTASGAQLQQFREAQALLQPFVSLGAGATLPLAQLTGTDEGGNPLTAPLTRPFTPDDLTKTPGYQFTLDQGLGATQNALTATGLGRSGNAVKAATDYSTSLAQSTWNQQMANYLAQNQQIYNMLAGLGQIGTGAAAGTAGLGAQAQSAANALLTGGAAAGAAGVVGSSQALANTAANTGLLLGSRI